MKTRFKQVGFAVLMFYMLFSVTLESVNTISRILLYAIPMITIAWNWRMVWEVLQYRNPFITIALLFLGVILGAGILIPILYQTFDFSFFKIVPFLMLQYALKSTFVLIVYRKLFKNEATLDRYLNFFSIACSLYILITFIFIWFPDLRAWWVELIHISAIDYDFLTSNRVSMDYVSRVGIDGFGGFMHTFIMSTGVIISLYRLMRKTLDQTVERKHIIFFLLFVVGCNLYGRTGSFVSYGCIFLLFCFYGVIKYWKQFMFSLLTFALALVAVFVIGTTSVKGGYWFNWNFDYLHLNINDIPPVFESNPDDVIVNESFDVLLKSFHIPPAKTLLLGDGYFTDPDTGKYYGQVDIGILRNVLFFGFPLSTVYYATLGTLLMGFFRVFYKRKDIPGFLFVVLITVQVLAFELKGGVIAFSFPILLPVLALLWMEQKGLE